MMILLGMMLMLILLDDMIYWTRCCYTCCSYRSARPPAAGRRELLRMRTADGDRQRGPVRRKLVGWARQSLDRERRIPDRARIAGSGIANGPVRDSPELMGGLISEDYAI